MSNEPVIDWVLIREVITERISRGGSISDGVYRALFDDGLLPGDYADRGRQLLSTLRLIEQNLEPGSNATIEQRVDQIMWLVTTEPASSAAGSGGAHRSVTTWSAAMNRLGGRLIEESEQSGRRAAA